MQGMKQKGFESVSPARQPRFPAPTSTTRIAGLVYVVVYQPCTSRRQACRTRRAAAADDRRCCSLCRARQRDRAWHSAGALLDLVRPLRRSAARAPHLRARSADWTSVDAAHRRPSDCGNLSSATSGRHYAVVTAGRTAAATYAWAAPREFRVA